MNFLKRQWEKFKQKTIWGKASDVFFILLLLAVLSNDGRIFLQQAILSTGLFGNMEENTHQPISEENWNWTLFDETGKRMPLKEIRGNKIFINTWATWCPPCNAEMPYIIELIKETPNTKYLFVTTEKPEKVKNHLTKKGWDIPVYYAAQLPIKELSYSSLPTTFIINEEGILIHRSEGMRKWNDEAIVSLLND